MSLLIMPIGIPGSGKTLLAQQLQSEFNNDFVIININQIKHNIYKVDVPLDSNQKMLFTVIDMTSLVIKENLKLNKVIYLEELFSMIKAPWEWIKFHMNEYNSNKLYLFLDQSLSFKECLKIRESLLGKKMMKNYYKRYLSIKKDIQKEKNQYLQFYYDRTNFNELTKIIKENK